jgi:hypothetical protein
MAGGAGHRDLERLSAAELLARARGAAVAVARSHGLRVTAPAVLADRSNLLVYLRPAPVVARVATTTALLRPDVHRWFARELAVAAFLSERGVGVVPPSRELPPGPHEHDGLAVTFWQHVEPDPGRAPSAAEAGEALRQLHRALREFPAGPAGSAGPGETIELPLLISPLVEVPRLLDRIESAGSLPPADLARLRGAHERLAEILVKPSRPVQALHGDAHVRNLLATRDGLLWNDFEDTCRGPVAWDLACFCRWAPWGPEAALAAYGDGDPDLPDLEALAPWLEARELQGASWLLAMSRWFPDRRPRADELLARWR